MSGLPHWLVEEVLDEDEIMDEQNSFEYSEHSWGSSDEAEWQYFLYDQYIHENALHGFFVPSLADQLQSLGTKHSMIGSRLYFQEIPAWEMRRDNILRVNGFNPPFQ